MFSIENIVPFLVGIAALLALKFALLHYSLKLATWWRKRSETPRKKCHDIFDYNFLDEYESDQGEPEPVVIDSSPSFSNCSTPSSSSSLNIQNATTKLLTSIRNRREQTAAALLNVSKLTTKPSAKDDDSDFNSQYKAEWDAKGFLKGSKYYQFLENIKKSRSKVE